MKQEQKEQRIIGKRNHACSRFRTVFTLQTVELKVRMCCSGCERVVKNAIYKLKGIDSVEVDLEMEKVTVIGYIDRNKVLKAVRRAGKKAEFWPYPNPPLYFTSTGNYFKDLTNDYKESYNYWRHGYNVGERHGTMPATHRGDDKAEMDSFSAPSTGSSSQMSTEDFMDQLKTQLAQAYAEEFLECRIGEIFD
ncbi:heavy metal transport/detoxification superfamily protein [Actinidia rufa]|uniref:Heavy metal transport/detoxification superfamily protein n=1 Tax=Actinidia rufa TaxID=165716 RepID=A0A7J0GZW6_9ERIC|nr:heavy metal transport/detoxification superfamily protein [Actinidia rufa]